MSEKRKIVITCSKRNTKILAEEITELGYSPTDVSTANVTIEGTYKDCMVLNMNLRTAHRVLFLIESFEAVTPDELYNQVYRIKWEDLIESTGYFSINSYVYNDNITDSRFANLRVKDAIADRFLNELDERPDSGPSREETVIFLHWVLNEVNLYFDTSGETIAKHGYRKMPYKAPLLESLACAMIKTSRWKPGMHFINPMCGSGTLAIEAALIAIDKAPGLFRNNFGFMHTKRYKQSDWDAVRSDANAKKKLTLEGKIIASDMSDDAIHTAHKNAKFAGVDHLIKFETGDFSITSIPEGEGVVMLNPEYGERMGVIDELEETYAAIGDFFKQRCGGKTGYVFTGNLQLGKRVGLKPKRKVEFYNGKLDCRLLEFELYQGSKRKDRDVSVDG